MSDEAQLDPADGHGGSFDELMRTNPVRSGLVGRSGAFDELFERICRLADARVPVLIRGEDGTEHENVAQALHWNSRRSPGPFIVERAGALREPHDLVQLFGMAKAAAPGSGAALPGLLDQANGGTLYLEEVADLPSAAQSSLVRALESGEFRPLGARAPQRSDFRLITSTAADLEHLVTCGIFRRDLYFRLRGAMIDIPPLRSRGPDLPLIVRTILAQAGVSDPIKAVSEEAMQAIVAYEWPGNLRELRHELLQAVALAEGRPLTPACFQFLKHPAPPHRPPRRSASDSPLRRELTKVEEAAIHDALRISGGNKAEAARRLGITRRTLYRRIKLLKSRAPHAHGADPSEKADR